MLVFLPSLTMLAFDAIKGLYKQLFGSIYCLIDDNFVCTVQERECKDVNMMERFSTVNSGTVRKLYTINKNMC